MVILREGLFCNLGVQIILGVRQVFIQRIPPKHPEKQTIDKNITVFNWIEKAILHLIINQTSRIKQDQTIR